MHPDLPFSYFTDLTRGLKQRFPHVHLKAFTMVEVQYFAKIAKLSIEDTLRAMKDAGVDSLPGGGAEIFHPRVRKVICDHKTSGQMWLSIARAAHQIGLRSNATMLYGHIENHEERVDHLLALPDDTLVLPGHMEETTIGEERQRNPYVRMELARRAGKDT